EVFNGKLSPSDEFVSVVDLIYFVVKEVPKRVLPFRHTQRPIITEVKNLSPDYFVCRNGNFIPTQISPAKFVRASMSVPFFFEPMVTQINNSKDSIIQAWKFWLNTEPLNVCDE